MATHRKALIVSASPHGRSLTAKFCQTFEKSFGAKYTTHLQLFAAEQPPYSDGTYKTDTKYQKLVLDNDVLFIATPTYWFNVPAILKSFLDDLSGIDTEKLWTLDRFLVVAVHSPQGGETGVVGALVLPLNMIGFTIPANGFVYYRNEDDDWAWTDLAEVAERLRYVEE